MPGLGTLVNVLAILAGGAGGLLFGRFLPDRFRDTMIATSGLIVLFLGIGGTLSQMLRVGSDGRLESTGTLMMLASLAIGAVVGELLDIDRRFTSFGEWLKERTGNARDPRFVDGFVAASLTVCIGAMAVVGAIEDVLLLNHTILYTKAVLDLIIVMIMTASMGRGCVFSALSVGLFQGSISLLAGALRPILTDAALSNLSLVGNVLIFAVGVNLLFGPKVKVANLLPALIVAVVWAFV
mgnify:CR=1 FL=1